MSLESARLVADDVQYRFVQGFVLRAKRHSKARSGSL